MSRSIITDKHSNEYSVDFFGDDEAEVWVAVNDEIPLALESESLDKLIARVKLAAPELIDLNNLSKYYSILLNIQWHDKMVYV